MVTRSRSSSFLNQEHHDHEDCVDGGGSGGLRRLGRISRSADGRFVLTRDSRSSSLSSTSDDGGFLSHPSFSNSAWSRRPLMAHAAAVTAATTATMTTADGSVRTENDSVDSRRRPIVVATVCGPQTPAGPYRASSPAAAKHQQPQQSAPQQPPPPAEWFFDLSSVVMPGGGGPAERTLRSVHEQYSQQLPSLRVIHEENQRTLLMQQQPGPTRYHPNPRFRSRHMRYARSAPELTSDVAHLHHQTYNHPSAATVFHHHQHAAYLHPVHHQHHQHHLHHYHHHVQPPHHPATAAAAATTTSVINERSPESRSSSSGFGSKNTTSSLHPNDWSGGGARAVPAPQLPPYKPPPPPAPLSSSLFYANDRWLDLAAPALPSSSLSPSSSRASPKPLSVDDQYEFDPIFPVSPTPTDVTAVLATARNTPVSSATSAAAVASGATPSPSSRSRTPTQLKKAKYENVEARLQAMKEEFYAYKRRQAEMARMSGQYVESAC